MGVYVPKGGQLTIQMHYTTYGVESEDRSQIAFYFHDSPPAMRLRTQFIANYAISIPPNSFGHEEKAYISFERDSYIHNLLPHAHYRGYSSKFQLMHLNGDVETLLSVPRYDFNWQRSYHFKEPIFAPAGSKLVQSFTYDNTLKNLANPDPSQRVRWGEQSWEEMLFASVQYRFKTEPQQETPPTLARRKARISIGFMDKDLDGLLSSKEMGKDLRKAIETHQQLDQNQDQHFDVHELERVFAKHPYSRER